MTKENASRDKKNRFMEGIDKIIKLRKANPLAAKIAVVAICAVIIVAIVLGIGNNLRVSSKVTALGLKDIGQIATQGGYYSNVQVIDDVKRLPWGWNIPLTHSKYIFSYDGVVKVGFEFGDIEVNVDDMKKIVHVHFPEVIVISNEIDYDSLMIYDEAKSIFTPLDVDDMNAAMLECEEEGLNNAVANGLFENARKNGEVIIRGFLSASFNPAEYTFEFEHAPISDFEAELTEGITE